MTSLSQYAMIIYVPSPLVEEGQDEGELYLELAKLLSRSDLSVGQR